MNRRLFLALATLAIAGPESAEGASVNRRFMMEDVNGAIVTDETLLGRFSLVYFGYTHCPDLCPTSLFVMAEVLRGLGLDADRLLCLFVTVDPERDTAERMSNHVRIFDDRIVALRGPKPYLDGMIAAFNAKYLVNPAAPDDPDNYSVDHTASIALVGPDGSIIKRYPHGMTARDILPDLRKFFAETPARAAKG